MVIKDFSKLLALGCWDHLDYFDVILQHFTKYQKEEIQKSNQHFLRFHNKLAFLNIMPTDGTGESPVLAVYTLIT